MPTSPTAGNSLIQPVLSWTNGDTVDSDTVDLTAPGRAIFVEVAGAVKFQTPAGETPTVTFPAGLWWTEITRLFTTGTDDVTKVWILR